MCATGFAGDDCSEGFPAISSVSINNAPTNGGPRVIIYGSRFGDSGTVSMGSPLGVCSIVTYADSSITCNVPPSNPGPTTILVTRAVGARKSNTVAFTYDSPVIGERHARVEKVGSHPFLPPVRFEVAVNHLPQSGWIAHPLTADLPFPTRVEEVRLFFDRRYFRFLDLVSVEPGFVLILL